MSFRCRLASAALSAAFAFALAAPTLAQENDESRRASARALFEEGMEHVREGRLEEAVDRLRRSNELWPSAVVAYNLSTALIELGRLVEASEHLRSAASEETAPAEVRAAAEQRLTELLPRIGRLTIELQGPPAGVAVTVDDAPLAEALLGVAQPADPGEHVVRALRDEAEVAHEVATIADGQAATVVLAIPPAVALPPLELPVPVEVAERRVEADLTAAAVAPAAVSGDGGFDTVAIVIGLVVGAVVAGAIATTAVVLTTQGPEPYRGDFEPGLVRVSE